MNKMFNVVMYGNNEQAVLLYHLNLGVNASFLLLIVENKYNWKKRGTHKSLKFYFIPKLGRKNTFGFWSLLVFIHDAFGIEFNANNS